MIELKYPSQFEYLPDQQLFTYQGDVFLKMGDRAIPYIDPTEDHDDD